MRILLTFTFLVFYLNSFSQTEKLYYFIEKDSLLGVKNQNGKIIIPAQVSWNTDSYLNNFEIKTKIFSISFKGRITDYYDRKGHFLFSPFPTGEGPDAFNEGFIRYGDNKKVGLYNNLGEKIISAKYDWISQINFGFARFCNGCHFDFSKDPEHPPLIGGTWGYVGKNGLEIIPKDKQNHPKDFETENHQFIPYQFEYNEKEKEILDFFEKRKQQIIQLSGFSTNETIYFEIVGKPSEFDPFYKIKTFELYKSYISGPSEYDDYKNFIVSEDGKNFYTTYTELIDKKDYSEYVEKKIPVDKWIKQNLKKQKE